MDYLNYHLKHISILLLLLLLIDLCFILYSGKSIYLKNNIIKSYAQFTTWLYGILIYILLAHGLYFFVIRNNIINYKQIILISSLFGLVIYGIYNLINLININGWNVKESIIDTIKGILLFPLVCILFKFINNFFNK